MLARRGVLVVVAVTAASAVLAGLARLGVALGVIQPWGNAQLPLHGPLFVLGVFATVIALERAVEVGRRWALLAPAASAVVAVLLLGAAHWRAWLPLAQGGAIASALALVLLNALVTWRRADAVTWLVLAGSLLLLGGNVAWWSGRAVYEVVPLWLAFLLLTIVAERLEFASLVPMPRWAKPALLAAAATLATTAVLALTGRAGATQLLGLAMLAIGAWQLGFDEARRTVATAGLSRYVAVGVLLAAGWLLVAGGLVAVRGLPPAGPTYDAALHAVLVGYVLSMVFVHVPIVLPQVAQLALPFSRALYLPLVVLHGGLLLRVLGDVLGSFRLRQAGGLANAVALALLACASWYARRRGARQAAAGAPGVPPGVPHA